MTCLCSGRADIRCDDRHCDLAGPGAAGDPNNCRICWLRLGRPLEGPSLISKVINFGKALVEHAAAGAKTVDAGLARLRLALCEECDYYSRSNDACAKCGCHMKLKTTWPEQHCPLGKW